jgi:diguanylate cyclase
MRYVEDRERSAGLLRLAIQHMGKHRAGFNPCSFAIWYEHCGGLNPTLSRILEARVKADEPLSDEDAWQLYTEHILARDIRQYESLREELYRILTDTTASAEVASEGASAFAQSLTHHARELASVEVPESVREKVADLRSDTGKMRALTTELAARLRESTAEVAALTESLRRAQSEALLDALTGLKNRRGFDEAARSLMLEQGGLAGVALMMVDIDHFKSVNDLYGHVFGDKVLHAIAHVLKTNIKGRDILARLGGEEFALLLPQTPQAGAITLGKQVSSLIAHGRIKRHDGQGTIRQVTVSVGIAMASADESLESLLERADSALYTAKRLGRNRVEVAPAIAT